MTYYFGSQEKDFAYNYVLSADDAGDITILCKATGTTRVVKLDQFSGRKFNWYEALASAILAGYPDSASIYITDDGKNAINNKVFKNLRHQLSA